MKNNITTYLLLIMFASFNVCNSSANEFLFNTTEINILDSGNVINATDGIAKSDEFLFKSFVDFKLRYF